MHGVVYYGPYAFVLKRYGPESTDAVVAAIREAAAELRALREELATREKERRV